MNLNALPGLALPGDAGGLAELTSALDESQLSSAFAQLLGARFAPAADGKQPPVALSTDDERAPALSRNQLNQLLATFGERGGLLPGLATPADALSSEGAESETLVAGDKPAQPPIAAAKELDAATLQALYAMLPAAIVAQPQPADGQRPLPVENADDAAALQTGNGLLNIAAAGDNTAARSSASPAPTGTGTKTPAADGDNATAALPQSTSGERASAAQPLPAGDTQQQPTLNHAVALAAASPTQTAAPAGSLVTAPPTPQLNAQLGSPEWQQALNQQVLMFHRNGQQSAELRLHPQELGALQIKLKLDDQQAQLHIASAHGQVRAAVEAAMPQLRHALAESGINLGQSSVGGESTPQWQQAQQQASNSQGRSSYAEHPGDEAAAADGVSAPMALQRMASAVNGVDIFA
ncbi:flagellar hook-length control protein FliK [Serratia marcescens]|uniref:Flagellar hook-length control protein n=2 Tax=Serratia marcescens TaxID=615 RepID=A0A379Z9D1_SERMA|nr:flagellar hook-length control protein FliK [Serratia marcescens]KFD13214.1 FliK family flagellar hook-length control protein [Serratia marcescens subsp. marcescens ATCC 13880]KFL02072.1 flagellar hook-length control FliK family protein [Serratia marcescens]MCC3247694.1 flagellar hook-length control protein FliK [Serratia marcescens]PNU45426.1 flagellar hook-length control protein FliK [Serratia marcescens subsp. marcescens ATCC 13880]QDL86104.1 flagellar hook-length control protein FliK [Se